MFSAAEQEPTLRNCGFYQFRLKVYPNLILFFSLQALKALWMLPSIFSFESV